MDLRSRGLPTGWYPDSAQACRREIEGFKQYINSFNLNLEQVRGGLMPHAGWFFSGRLAALVLDLAARSGQPDVVAVFGGHLGHGRGIIYADRAWETPLGNLEMDRELSEALVKASSIKPEGTSTHDNTVEIQLPLVKYYFPDSLLLAARVPQTDAAMDIGRLTAELAMSQGKTLFAFGSTDLTHYGPNYGFSPQGLGSEAVDWVREVNDKGFIELALEMNEPGMLEHANRNSSACSAGGAAAAVAALKTVGALHGNMVDYYTSYDIMPGSSFVGYAGIVYQH